jgi:hypothetical protein
MAYQGWLIIHKFFGEQMAGKAWPSAHGADFRLA